MSISEVRELSSIELSAIEHVSSSVSVPRVLLIHLNSPDKIFSPGPVYDQEFFYLHQTPRTNFLVPGVDPELVGSPHFLSPRTNFLALGSDLPSHFPYPGPQR